MWLALLAIAFVVAVGACHSGGRWRLHALIVGGLAAVAASGYLAWTSARGRAFADESQAPPLSDDTRRQRTQWMRLAGLASSLWFLLVILAMEVPLLILGECQ